MTTPRARYGKIERLTESILATSGISSPAVDVRALIINQNIEIRSGDLGEISGVLARSDKQTMIGVNKKQAVVRQRFTMAHEFGHYFLHEGIRTHWDEGFRLNYRDDQSATASDVEEVEANFFAACLLMPRRFLDAKSANRYMDDDAGVKSLAKSFNVSQHAMSLRLVNLYRRHSPF